MADFGAKLCSEPECRQHDFLPFTCSACGLVFCQAHMAIGSGHRCSRGEEYLASRRDEGGRVTSTTTPAAAPAAAGAKQVPSTASVAKPSEVMSAVISRFDGREDELNVNVTHFNIKTSEGQAGDGDAGAPDKLLKSTQLAMEKAATVKGKRVSKQVHRMLLKSKAVGDKKVRMDDRYFLEVHYCGNDTDVHYLFFSRLWTVGRALDDILKTRRRHLRLEPGEEGLPLELAREGSLVGLPTGGILNSLSPEKLQSFDAVTVRPRAVQPAPGVATITAEGSGISGGGNSSHTAATVPGSTSVGAPAEATLPTAASGSSSGGVNSEPALVSGVGEAGGLGRRDHAVVTGSGATLEKAGSAAATGAGGGVAREEGGMTITVGHGKAVYELGGVVPDRDSVLDIKRRLEPITGVPFSRQKLLYKGVLRDHDKIGATKIVQGAKLMLLGAGAAAKKK